MKTINVCNNEPAVDGNIVARIAEEFGTKPKIYFLTCRSEMEIIRDNYDTIVPGHSEKELKALEDSICRNGCLEPLVAYKGRNDDLILLDGYARFYICYSLNIPFRVIEIEFPNRIKAGIYFIKSHAARKSITKSQLAYLAALLEGFYIEEENENKETRLEESQELDPAGKAARDLGVTLRALSYAKTVDMLECTPDSRQEVKQPYLRLPPFQTAQVIYIPVPNGVSSCYRPSR